MSQNPHPQEDPLAYGHYYSQDSARSGSGSTRGLMGDTFKKLKDTYKSHQGSHSPQPAGQGQQQSYTPAGGGYQQQYHYASQNQPNAPYQNSLCQDPQYQGKPAKQDKVSGFLGKLQGTVAELGTDVAQRLGTAIDPQAYAQYGQQHDTESRFGSFAPPRQGNDVKWYVDGCSYFYAVSRALENAKESVWIMDWWLSPELYLRRPPAKNEQYRLDRMLHAAAQRGVRVNIIVYKEVAQALTLSSSHTKHHLEDLHPNIAVFRHPDHLPEAQGWISSLENLPLDAPSLAKMPEDTIKQVYDMNDDVALYWSHHEKLCLIDDKVAFMGGLDLCFGRWDTNQHAISDVHPAELNEIVFPGQDYNNARVLDFQDVSHWEQNQLDRKSTARMGWSDVALSLHGQVVDDLRRHFVERWNFIYDSKYETRHNSRYSQLALYGRPLSSMSIGQVQQPQQHGFQQQQQQQVQPQWQQPQNSGWQQQPQAGHQSSPQQPLQSQLQPQQLQPQNSGSQQSLPQQAPQFQQQHQVQPQWQQSQPQYQQVQTQYQQPPQYPGQQQQQQQYPQYQYQSQGQQPPQQQQQQYQPYRPGAVADDPSTPGQGALHQGTPGYKSPPNYSEHQPQATPQGYTYTGQSFPSPPPGPPPNLPTKPAQPQQTQNQAPYYPPPPTQDAPHSQTRSIDEYERARGEGDSERGLPLPRRFKKEDLTQYGNALRGQLAGQIHQYQDRFTTTLGRPQARGNMSCQVVRSCAKWSHGSHTEHSIQDAYAAVIRNSEHFVYIENQFFVTATGDSQHPVKNNIGAAIVERILRAARAGQKYKIIVVIPCVPCFAGDLSDESTLGTRVIMELQYNSISRGGSSIMELIAKEGYNPMDYIRFYNLRNYDRINISGPLAQAEQRSGVNYEEARREHDVTTTGPGGYGPGAPQNAFDPSAPFHEYQNAAHQVSGGKQSSGRWDSVSECYMLNGEDIRKVPWEGPAEAEIDAFVTEELYIHSKVMIADDRIVICGSANINDRSQLGGHDSEIAMIIEDCAPIQSTMDGKPWTASRFAASLRRELYRKHLGLLPPQDPQRPDANFEPIGVPNRSDLDAPESHLVADPLANTIDSLWNTRARTNTEVFRKVFHVVPDDSIRDWNTYKEFYGYYFHNADKQTYGEARNQAPARYRYGHVVRDDFPPGPEGVKQVKEQLSQVKGTLVEMPLMFLIHEDVAKEGWTLNDLIAPIFT